MRYGGRVKGTPNKLTGIARTAIEIAAKTLGGAKRLAEWAKEDPLNERAFWATIYPKLLPIQISGEGGGALNVHYTISDKPATPDEWNTQYADPVADESQVKH
jgi:hypothetical protein